MKRRASALLGLGIFAIASLRAGAALAVGLGNLTYTAAEYQMPIAVFNAATFKTGPGGSNTALMLRDYFIVMGSNDSGKPPGAIHVFDVKDPRKPILLKTLANTPETNNLRELHAMPVAMIDGKDFLVMPTLTGIQFFDFTDPMNIKPVGALPLMGVNAGDYDNAAWQISWAWPYVFVGGTGNGLYIVDGTNPAAPTLVTRVATGSLGNFRVGPTHAAGNYVVLTGMDQGPTKISVLDVSNPRAPFLTITGMAPAEMYAALVVGDRIYGSGATGNYSFVKWTPTAISMIALKKFGTDKGGYCTYQDGFAICGQSSEGYRKIDVRDEANIREVGHADIPNEASADTDFATVMGNLVFLGNDHGSGAAFIPHSMAPDTLAPTIMKSFPGDGELRQPLTTRMTIFFSDEIDIGSITATNIVVRKNGGAAVAGVFSHSSFNAVSFGPRQPLEANTTYEIVIPAGGLKDLVGNAIKTSTTIRFSTGTTLAPPLTGGGGAGGSASGTGGIGGGGGGSTTGTGGAGTGGGSAGTGGTTGTGGDSGGTGGAISSTGGAMVLGSGGAAPQGSGGSTIGSGGAPVGQGGNPGTGGTGTMVTGPAAAGCACNVPGGPASNGALMLIGAVLWMGARRTRGRRPRVTD